MAAAEELGRDVMIGSVDLSEDLLAAIEAGDISFTIDQQQYLQGYISVLALYLDITNKNTLGGGLPINTGPGFVTRPASISCRSASFTPGCSDGLLRKSR